MTLTGLDKTNAVQMYALKKSGSGWYYDDPTLTYDVIVDSVGREVFYDSLGESITLTGQDKPSVSTLTALDKNQA